MTDREIRGLRRPGYHSDGDGLNLQVSASTANDPKIAPARSWILRFRWRGKQREMGLGPYPDVSLSRARELAAEARDLIREGVDPIEQRKIKRGMIVTDGPRETFGVFGHKVVDDWSKRWKNPKHIDQWRKTLNGYAAVLKNMPIAEIETDHVLSVLRPIWETLPETAGRVRGRIERILDAARVAGLRTAENPARWHGHLKLILSPPQKLARGHHSAVAWKDMLDLMTRLRKLQSPSAYALEATILTALRTSECIGGVFAEFDLDSRVWTVPAARMKMKIEHRVPLSDRMLEIVNLYGRLSRYRGYVFPGKSAGRPLSNMAMLMCLRGLDDSGVTVHGFRSTFRDWCKEYAKVPRELAELCLAHRLESNTEAAYSRGDALDARREIMQAWDDYLMTGAIKGRPWLGAMSS